jgi:hypothetical protein
MFLNVILPNHLQAVALAVMPLLVPAVLEMSDEKYVPNVVLMFAIASFIGIVGGVFWNYLDYRSGFVCNSAGQNTSSARASLVSVDNNGGVDVPEGFKTEQSIRFSMMSRHSMISEDEKVTEVEFKKSISVTR